MADRRTQYLRKLAFISEMQRAFPLDAYDKPVSQWTREEKASLTRAYNKALIATASADISINADSSDYAQMVRLMRPFVDGFEASDGFDLRDPRSWTPAQRGKITRYFREVNSLASRPFEVYHPKNDEIKGVAMRASGQRKGFPGIKGVFVPVQSLGQKVRIKVDPKKKTVTVDTPNHSTVAVDWESYGVSFDDLESDPQGAIQRVVDQVGMRKYSINAGAHSVGKGVPLLYTPNALANKVAELVRDYGSAKFNPNDSSSHHYSNWMTGIRGYQFDNPKGVTKWGSAYRRESTQRKEEKKRQRKRMRYYQQRGKKP